MTSPLLPYANAYLLVPTLGTPSVVAGRITQPASTLYLLHCYLKRQDSTGTSTGADYLPTQLSPGDRLPGTSGEAYLYRGYALRHQAVASDFTFTSPIPTANWLPLTSTPTWLPPGTACQHLQGTETPKPCRIERNTGRYGGTQIDALLVAEIGGIPLTIRSGDLTG